ncbi:hypothetical protein GW17_00018187 [Ensete ventricosum]|nr:hypothetical protein GW17_00018187 [Ensete ventricosum]
MVEIASTQLEGDAIQWYDLYETYHRVPSWGQFKRELLIRFGPSEYKNINGQLAKINQTSTVNEYQSRFEHLSNQARDWSEIQFVRKFIKGLNLEIRCEVKACHPRTMIAAISFASVHEGKINTDTHRNISFYGQEKSTKEDFKVVNIDDRKQEQLLTIEPTKEESKTDGVKSDHESYAKFEDKIANGQILIYDNRCSKVKQLLVDFFLMPREDFEVVILKRRHGTITSHRMKRVLQKTTMVIA